MTANKNDLDEKMQFQLDLFGLVEFDPRKKSAYSNTMELYDALPKYNWGTLEVNDMQEAEMTREIQLRGQLYVITVTPAMITRGGRKVMVFPGAREEIVEKALRKFVIEGQGEITGREVGVTFTLYQLYKELSKHGKTLSYAEIVEAIEVCQGSRLEVVTHSGQTVVRSNFFPTVALTTRQDYINSSGDTNCYARFNPLVTESIINMTFRRYNYEVDMAISSALARYMHQRMSHYWTQASPKNPYTFSLVKYLTQSPRGISKMMSVNIRAMNNALEHLVKHKIISHYKDERIKDGRRIADVRYTVYPHEVFVGQMISNNRHFNRLQSNILKQDTQTKVRSIAGARNKGKA